MLFRSDNVKRAEADVKTCMDREGAARQMLNLATKERMKIDEHRAVWLAEEAAEQEAKAEGELEDFTVRKQEI